MAEHLSSGVKLFVSLGSTDKRSATGGGGGYPDAFLFLSQRWNNSHSRISTHSETEKSCDYSRGVLGGELWTGGPAVVGGSASVSQWWDPSHLVRPPANGGYEGGL
ncbi:unnamed protein product [Arctogadus glacialis]